MDRSFWKKGFTLGKKEEETQTDNSLFSGVHGGESDGFSTSEYMDHRPEAPAAKPAPSLFSGGAVSGTGAAGAGEFAYSGESPDVTISAPAEKYAAEGNSQNGRQTLDPSLFMPPEEKKSAEPVRRAGEEVSSGTAIHRAGEYVQAEPIHRAGQSDALFRPPTDEPIHRAGQETSANEPIHRAGQNDALFRPPAEEPIHRAGQETPANEPIHRAGQSDALFQPPADEPEIKETETPAAEKHPVFEAPPEPDPVPEEKTAPPEPDPVPEEKTAPPEPDPVPEEKTAPPEPDPVPEEKTAPPEPDPVPEVKPAPPEVRPVEKAEPAANEPAPAFMPVFSTPDASPVQRKSAAAAPPENEGDRLSEEEVRLANAQIRKVIDNVETAIIGKRTVVELVLMTMLARGHVLLADVPGVGKTSLVSCIARSVDCDFKRIQFTPDLMPSDITGFSIYNQKSGEFEFRPGSAMSNIVLADEINRASAKTQSAMLEIMEEKQVTVDSQTFEMEEPFFVMATQNPVESFGTYPLPEAQIDRFMVKLAIGYPKVEEEQRIVHSGREAKKNLSAVISRQEVLHLREQADRVWVDPVVERYIVEIVAATRANAKIVLGSSPRGSIALNNAAKVYALFQNRGYVIPDDVKYLAPHILAHRLILSHDAKNDQTDPQELINEIVSSIVAPR